ncbi:myelin P2 protein-like [Rhineura floridana]|uniref:myelin P2 protein-like n=1 Tax=Rhineura floridana TaxID=261503 RepID=UPI002AC8207D|nr:myelin P2 protein-like [Rhineura floridana]
MLEYFVGTWKFVSHLNLSDYTQAFAFANLHGFGITTRDHDSLPKPIITISRAGDVMMIKTESPIEKTETSFKLGQEFEETTADNRKTKSLVTMEDDGSLLHAQKWGGNRTLIRRKVVDNIMVVECTIKNVTSSRVYQRVQEKHFGEP